MIAKRTGAKLQLVQVHLQFVAAGVDAVVVSPEIDAMIRRREREYLDNVSNGLKESHGIQPEWDLAEGPVIERLLARSRRPEVDLVVMTTHGLGGLKRLWLGSVADQLVREAGCPVLLLRPTKARNSRTEAKPFRHILVPLDGSVLSETALGAAVALARINGAHVDLLQVVPQLPQPSVPQAPEAADPSPAGDELAEAARSLAEERLRQVARTFGALGIRARSRVVAGERVAEEILRETASLRADLVVMATHGRGGLERFVLGSVADKVIRGARVPVLAVRPPRKPAQRKGLGSWAAASCAMVVPRDRGSVGAQGRRTPGL
jgi:nucleotide-binding universal stress UspA family protein